MSPKPHNEVTGSKLTQANIAFAYQGDLVGEGELRYLLFYGEDGVSGHYVELERVTGTLGGRAGTFVLQHQGTFAEQAVQGSFAVIPGSGMGELRSLRGTDATTVQAEPWSITLDYALA